MAKYTENCRNCGHSICRKTCCGKKYECKLGYVRPVTHFEPMSFGHGGVAVDDPGHVEHVDAEKRACQFYVKR